MWKNVRSAEIPGCISTQKVNMLMDKQVIRLQVAYVWWAVSLWKFIFLRTFLYMSGGSVTDIYCYRVNVYFFSIKLKLFSRRLGPPGVRICNINFVRVSVCFSVCLSVCLSVRVCVCVNTLNRSVCTPNSLADSYKTLHTSLYSW